MNKIKPLIVLANKFEVKLAQNISPDIYNNKDKIIHLQKLINYAINKWHNGESTIPVDGILGTETKKVLNKVMSKWNITDVSKFIESVDYIMKLDEYGKNIKQ